MLIVPDPPADVMLGLLTFNVTPHRSDEGLVGVTDVDEELQAVASAAIRRIDE